MQPNNRVHILLIQESIPTIVCTSFLQYCASCQQQAHMRTAAPQGFLLHIFIPWNDSHWNLSNVQKLTVSVQDSTQHRPYNLPHLTSLLALSSEHDQCVEARNLSEV